MIIPCGLDSAPLEVRSQYLSVRARQFCLPPFERSAFVIHLIAQLKLFSTKFRCGFRTHQSNYSLRKSAMPIPPKPMTVRLQYMPDYTHARARSTTIDSSFSEQIRSSQWFSFSKISCWSFWELHFRFATIRCPHSFEVECSSGSGSASITWNVQQNRNWKTTESWTEAIRVLGGASVAAFVVVAIVHWAQRLPLNHWCGSVSIGRSHKSKKRPVFGVQ